MLDFVTITRSLIGSKVWFISVRGYMLTSVYIMFPERKPWTGCEKKMTSSSGHTVSFDDVS